MFFYDFFRKKKLSHRTRHRWEYEFDRLVRFHIKQRLLIPSCLLFHIFSIKTLLQDFLFGRLSSDSNRPSAILRQHATPTPLGLILPTPHRDNCATLDMVLRIVGCFNRLYYSLLNNFFFLSLDVTIGFFIIIHNHINNFELSHHGAVSGT